MADHSNENPATQPRERRDRDRRAGDRRSPAGRAGAGRPGPWVYLSLGAVGLLLAIFLLRTGGREGAQPDIQPEELARATPAPIADTLPPPGLSTAPREVGTADYERLVAEGEGALGRRVVVQLYCEGVNSVSLRVEVPVPASVAAVTDAAGRVPAARCRWGIPGEGPDFLLLVPPELATDFGNAPMIEESFVRRKAVRAEVEWLGRSDALALRTAGVLRAIL